MRESQNPKAINIIAATGARENQTGIVVEHWRRSTIIVKWEDGTTSSYPKARVVRFW